MRVERPLIVTVPRMAIPGSVHHVMVNAIHGQRLYLDDEDRRMYLNLVHKVIEECRGRLHFLSILSTHAHLGEQVGEVPLHLIMKRINERYGRYFNRKYKRLGYVFRGKYRSKPILDDVYHRNVVVYVHRNRIEAGIVASVDDLLFDEFTAHGALMDFVKPRAMDVNAVLRVFGPTVELARGAYLQQMNRVFNPADREQFEAFPSRWTPTGSTYIGRDSFARSAEERIAERDRAAARWVGWSLDQLIVAACAVERVRIEDLVAKGRSTQDASRLRASIAWLATERLGLRQTDVARRLGIGQSALSQARSIGAVDAIELEAQLLGEATTTTEAIESV